MSEIDKDQKEELRQLGERAHWAYERHRNLGVALMATILGLSGGGLVILGRDKNPFAALYIVPILLAVLQQHLTYQASRHLSRGQNLTMRLFVEQPTLDAAPSGTSPQRDGMRQQMNYEFEMESAYSGQAHRISVLTVYAFILFTLVCVGFIYMASVAISFLAVLILSS